MYSVGAWCVTGVPAPMWVQKDVATHNEVMEVISELLREYVDKGHSEILISLDTGQVKDMVVEGEIVDSAELPLLIPLSTRAYREWIDGE